jgi:hypothetical protein
MAYLLDTTDPLPASHQLDPGTAPPAERGQGPCSLPPARPQGQTGRAAKGVPQ